MLIPPREIDQWADEKRRDHLHRLTGRAAVGAAPHGLPRPPAGRAARRATRSSSRPRRSPATSARSTRRSTGCTTSAATSSPPRDAPIHASGHGYAEELKMMLNLTRPRYVMPVHGDFKRMLHPLAARRGRRHPAREHLPRRERHCRWRSTRDGARLGERETAGMIFVDGVDIGDVADVALRDRRMLVGRRHLHHRRDRVRAGRLVGRPARGARARRAVPRRQRPVRRRAARGGRGLPRPRGASSGSPRSTCSSRFLHDDLASVHLRAAQAPPDGAAGRRRGLGGEASARPPFRAAQYA